MASQVSAASAAKYTQLHQEEVARYHEHVQNFFNRVENGDVDGAVQDLGLMPAWIKETFIKMNPHGAKVEMYVENTNDPGRYQKVINLALALRQGGVESLDVFTYEAAVHISQGRPNEAAALFKQYPGIQALAKSLRDNVYSSLESAFGPRTTLMNLVTRFSLEASDGKDNE